MNYYQYEARRSIIKRRNWLEFIISINGLAVLLIGVRVLLTNPDIPYQQKMNMWDTASTVSYLGIGATSLGFTAREYRKLEELEEKRKRD